MTIELIAQIFELVIIPLLGVLSGFLVKLIASKTEEILANTKDKKAEKYIAMFSETITACVIATNQTYVEALKKQGRFGPEAQKEAFAITLNAITATLTEEAKKYLTEVYGDLNVYIQTQIEAAVNQNKAVG